MNAIAISDVACWGDKDVAHRVARELMGLYGVELTPFRAFDESDIDSGVVAFHGSPLVTRRSLYNRLRFGPRSEVKFAILWQLMIGPLFGTPGIEIAREYQIPIILHHENILELMLSEEISKLKDLSVLVENSNFFSHPLIKGDLLESFSRALRCVCSVVDDVGIVVDVEHLAQYHPSGGYSLEEFCDHVENLAPIAEFHICDSVPGKRWQGHLVPGRGTMPLKEQLACIGFWYPEVPVVLEHSPEIGMLKFLPLSTQERFDAVIKDATEALEFVSSALRDA